MAARMHTCLRWARALWCLVVLWAPALLPGRYAYKNSTREPHGMEIHAFDGLQLVTSTRSKYGHFNQLNIFASANYRQKAKRAPKSHKIGFRAKLSDQSNTHAAARPCAIQAFLPFHPSSALQKPLGLGHHVGHHVDITVLVTVLVTTVTVTTVTVL
eukprot:1137119-Pelagomonas_calceolata.AAC.2